MFLTKIKRIFHKNKIKELNLENDISYEELKKNVIISFIQTYNHLNYIRKNLLKELNNLKLNDFTILRIFNYVSMINDAKSCFTQMILNAKSPYVENLYKIVKEIPYEYLDKLVVNLKNIQDFKDNTKKSKYIDFEKNIVECYKTITEYCYKSNFITYAHKYGNNIIKPETILEIANNEKFVNIIKKHYIEEFRHNNKIVTLFTRYSWFEVFLNIIHVQIMRIFDECNSIIKNIMSSVKKENKDLYETLNIEYK